MFLSATRLSWSEIRVFNMFQFKPNHLFQGMMMVSPAVNPRCCWEFEGEILVLHHPTTISARYQVSHYLLFFVLTFSHPGYYFSRCITESAVL